jgi:hypothetical protein
LAPNQTPPDASTQHRFPAIRNPLAAWNPVFDSFQRRLHPNNYPHTRKNSGHHPLLVNRKFRRERRKLINVAFEQDFWESSISGLHDSPLSPISFGEESCACSRRCWEDGTKIEYAQVSEVKYWSVCSTISCTNDFHSPHNYLGRITPSLEPGTVDFVRGAVQPEKKPWNHSTLARYSSTMTTLLWA